MDDQTLRLLLVEDNEDDAMLIIREMRRSGLGEIEYLRVDTPAAMGEALQTTKWDLVITDHKMPQFNSLDALNLVKQSTQDIPVIIVSGKIGEELAVSVMKSGAADYIMKDNLVRLAPAVERELQDASVRRAHRSAERTIHHMAYHDALTDLMNRREFDKTMQQALKRAREGWAVYALLYLDLDQFKVINDTCGHLAGDELLRQLAMVLRREVRMSDALARLGGDEFSVLLGDCTLSRAEAIANGLRDSIKRFRFTWKGKVFSVGVSIGIAGINGESESVEEVLSNADMACYAAKESGRDRVHIYTTSDVNLRQRRGQMQWVARIDQALSENRLLLYQQPIVSLVDGVSAEYGFEFLLRMRGSEGELIEPGAFLPAAERFGLMSRIDRWVVTNVLAHLAEKKLPAPAGREARFFINLSGSSLGDSELFRCINNQIEQAGVDPRLLCFEVTETAAIADLGNAVNFISKIKGLGSSFALDDFGTGLSSFSYLKALPVDFLKIDGSFVRNMANDPMDFAIVEAINRIGHVTGHKTIAEFVEDEKTRNLLCELGVDYAQAIS